MAVDAGLQPERTRLAWQRTTLTGLAALLLALRLTVEVSPALAVISTVTVGVALAIPVWSATRWQLQHPTLDAALRTDGRAHAVLALIVTLACLTALAYVLFS